MYTKFDWKILYTVNVMLIIVIQLLDGIHILLESERLRKVEMGECCKLCGRRRPVAAGYCGRRAVGRHIKTWPLAGGRPPPCNVVAGTHLQFKGGKVKTANIIAGNGYLVGAVLRYLDILFPISWDQTQQMARLAVFLRAATKRNSVNCFRE